MQVKKMIGSEKRRMGRIITTVIVSLTLLDSISMAA
jgi:hypothetical protein